MILEALIASSNPDNDKSRAKKELEEKLQALNQDIMVCYLYQKANTDDVKIFSEVERSKFLAELAKSHEALIASCNPDNDKSRAKKELEAKLPALNRDFEVCYFPQGDNTGTRPVSVPVPKTPEGQQDAVVGAAAEWHVASAGGQSGPHTAQLVRAMIQQGTVAVEPLVWNAGMADWVAIANCPDLAGLISASPPPPPPLH